MRGGELTGNCSCDVLAVWKTYTRWSAAAAVADATGDDDDAINVAGYAHVGRG